METSDPAEHGELWDDFQRGVQGLDISVSHPQSPIMVISGAPQFVILAALPLGEMAVPVVPGK